KLEAGKMVLDVLIELDVPIGFARTRVMPCLVTPREQVGKALGIHRTTAALELEEVIYVGGGNPVAYSRDLFAPGALDVHVMRTVARPQLQALVAATGETATLSVPGEGAAVTIDFVHSESAVASVARLGRPSVAHATAAGKVMLAFAGERAGADELVAFTVRT